LSRLPADTEILLHLRVKDALASPLATGLRTPEFDAQLTAPNPMFPGVTLAGINHVTGAIPNATPGATRQKMKGAAPPPPPGALPFPTEPIVVVALNGPLTPEALKLPADGAIKQGSSTIYRNPGAAAPGAPPCLCLLAPNALLMGSEAQLK